MTMSLRVVADALATLRRIADRRRQRALDRRGDRDPPHDRTLADGDPTDERDTRRKRFGSLARWETLACWRLSRPWRPTRMQLAARGITDAQSVANLQRLAAEQLAEVPAVPRP